MKIKHWDMFAFVLGYHILLLALLPACIANFSWAAFWLFLVTYIMGGMAITVGYHRLYAHRAYTCLLYTSPSPRDRQKSRMPSSA